jgi:broad specificity phosphatase PhoE
MNCMSSLTLVRHAQASFFADHYDQLSSLGEKQSQLLGEHWALRQWIVDEAYVGPRQRQQQTAAVVAAMYREAGLPFPEPVILAELDEYDLSGILLRLAPALAREDKDFARLLAHQRHGATKSDQARNFQRMFEPLLIHWQTAGTGLEGLESWPAFRDRVQRGLRQMTDGTGHGRHVVAFTSGGFIGTAVQLVLGAPDRTALEINWRIRNAAQTEFVFTRERITLDDFNSIAHLADPELMTFR